MPKLKIIRGVSGSGKSTLSREQNAKVVSRDQIRIGLFNMEFDPAIEEEVTLIEHAMIKAYLKAGYDVISDNTNIEWKFVKKIANVGYSCGAEVELVVLDVPLETCIKRNDHRAMMGGRMVPHDVIRKQYERFQKTKNMTLEPTYIPEPYFGTPGKPKAFLVDLDGTLANFKGIRGPYDINVENDEVFEVISELVQALYISGDYEVIFMSGRKEAARDGSIAWLEKHVMTPDYLFMRRQDDDRSDNQVKAELFDTYVRDNFDVRFVFDDRNQVVDMWRKMGLTCAQVAEGDF